MVELSVSVSTSARRRGSRGGETEPKHPHNDTLSFENRHRIREETMKLSETPQIGSSRKGRRWEGSRVWTKKKAPYRGDILLPVGEIKQEVQY